VGFASDAQGFVDGFKDGVAFVAHMGGIDAAEFSGFGGESDEFIRFGIGSGSVFERCGNANRAVFHGVAHKSFHLLQFFGRRLFVVVAENHAPDLRGADIAGQVDAHALLLDARKILAKGAPVGGDVIVLVAGMIGLNDGVIERCDGTAFPGNFRGDALIDFRRQAGIDEDGELGLAKHIDEAGSNDSTGGVNGAFAGGGGEISDGGDFSMADAEVAGIPGRAGSVDDVAVGDDKVECRDRLRGDYCNGYKKKSESK
jgi:hypothetical protein